jgi:hypothetical protein
MVLVITVGVWLRGDASDEQVGGEVIDIPKPHEALVSLQSELKPHDEESFSIFVSLRSSLQKKTHNFPRNAVFLLAAPFDLRLKTMAHASRRRHELWYEKSFLSSVFYALDPFTPPYRLRVGWGRLKGDSLTCLLPEHERSSTYKKWENWLIPSAPLPGGSSSKNPIRWYMSESTKSFNVSSVEWKNFLI